MTEEGPNSTGQADPGGGGVERSVIARPWLVRIVIIVSVLVGYGIWSAYDAFVSYPKRGADYASHCEWAYLEKAIEADRVESPGVLRREAAIADPAGELERLDDAETMNRNLSDAGGGPRQKRAEMELARERWLTALSRIGHLHPAYTNFYSNPDPAAKDRLVELNAGGTLAPEQKAEAESLLASLAPMAPKDRFAALNQRWTVESPPGPLQGYDIPVNKLATVLCAAFAVYLISLFVMVATKTYTWDAKAKRLTLPGGESLVPGDLSDVDKRKWDKFIVYLKIKDEHPKLGGSEVRFDTYRTGKIEGWILEMEKAAFPERVAAEEAAKRAAEEAKSSTGPQAAGEPA